MPGLHDVTRGRLLYGGDYNPEQWPPHVWREDVALMRDAGVNLVTVGVFAWAQLQPAPDRFTFDWLDTVLDLLHDGGVDVALATPTASPPPWLGHHHPDTLPQGPDGIRRLYGSRNQYCPCAPAYRAAALRISDAVAARYAHHPALRLWHIGNEYGTTCHCDHCAARFRDWLRRRHGDLDGLNTAWGTAVWSQRYDDWAQVLPPRRVQYVINPAQDLDYQRFCDDMLLECFAAERDTVRAHNPTVPVTTNFMDTYRHTDGWRWAAAEDLVSLDTYPDPNDPGAAPRAAMSKDIMRSLGGGRPWLLAEQSPGAASWRPVATPKRPGLNRLWSMQAVARGADGVLHFQWRASRQGAERAHGAMVPHAGPDSRVFREIRALGRELAGLSGVVGTTVPADVAIVLDWDAWRAAELDHQPHAGFRYVERLLEYYTPLWRDNVTCDFAPAAGALDRYRLVLVPNLYQVSAAAAATVTGYVAAGGTVVVGPFTGVADPDERVYTGGWPGPWQDLLGVRIEEHWPLPDGARLDVASAALGDFTATTWAEWGESRGADVVATVRGGPLAGRPMVLRNPYHAGTAWYVATQPSPDAMHRLLRRVCAEAGVAPVLPDLPPDVEAVRRGDLVFLLHHDTGRVEIRREGHHDPAPH
ncbi:beta-galactosidase [Dactylosporangium aurantiacum]|uniref:Beta-galactosidase n=1 Tax=Dactylosporangium aurantiacum TaxID=35754 RepID=A0A9Q9MDT3_9ACTN|nr:beta-galactosidase [Dactylosporangium aurantiacum]MDG6107007.1 beta-galactosidase [Dactylosporangium aurantiacum]UWZ50635.1 beta-galactosidase [Dactylosporangium aurantiacum]